MPSLRFITAFLVLLFAVEPALAWTEATRRRMIEDALKLAPPALVILLDRYREDLIRGMLDPSREESDEDHRQRIKGDYGLAARMIASRAHQAMTLMGQPGRLRMAVYALGTTAHFVADVNFPLNDGEGPPGDPVYYRSYQRYAEGILGRFPVALNPEPSQELRESRIEDFGRAAALRASAFIPSIREAYTPEGRPKSAQAFDERSLPFGIAALSYSNAVTDIGHIWVHIWRESGGDLEGLPFSDTAWESVTKPAEGEEDGTSKKAPGAD